MKFLSEEQKKILATGKHYKTELSGFYYKIIATAIKIKIFIIWYYTWNQWSSFGNAIF